MKIIPIPYEKGGCSKTVGCSKAPEEIIKTFNEEYNNKKYQMEESEDSKPLLKKIEVKESKELIEAIKNNETQKRIGELIEEVSEKDSIFIGGDHSITFFTFKALKKLYKMEEM